MRTRPAAEQPAVCVLGSGSRGNAVYISDGVTSILVDAGFSAREIDRRLRGRGIDPSALDAVLLTHEHTDHVKGVERLVRRYRLPVYLDDRHLPRGRPAGHPSRAGPVRLRPRVPNRHLTVHPFCISHDAGDPAGFTITANGIRIGIATDLGQTTALVRDHLQGCRVLILESNHDPDMLMKGPYPWFLKQRIHGRTGHLSNRESCLLLSEVVHSGLEHVILAHLSETNNTPQMALAEAGRVLPAPGCASPRRHRGKRPRCCLSPDAAIRLRAPIRRGIWVPRIPRAALPSRAAEPYSNSNLPLDSDSKSNYSLTPDIS